MLSAKKIAQTIAARTEWKIHGGYFKLLSATTALDLELWSDAGGLVLTAPSVEPGFYLRAAFDRVVITPPASQAVSWLAAPEEGGSDRLAGDVSMVDGGKARTLAGQAFLGAIPLGALAANISHCQLFNPAGSGVRVVVSQFAASPGAAGVIRLLMFHTALTTLQGAARSKLQSAGAGSLAELRTQHAAAALGTTPYFIEDQVGADLRTTARFAEPLILAPGAGLMCYYPAVNTALSVWFEFFEEPNV